MNRDFILKYIMTVEQKNDLINLLENLLEDVFKQKINHTPETLFEKKVLEMIYFQIEKLKINGNRIEMEMFLKTLLEEVRVMPELKLTVAISPTEKLLEKLKDWAEVNKLSNFVFDIEVKPEIIAGAIIITREGKYIKYSLSEMIDNYFLNNKQEITSLL